MENSECEATEVNKNQKKIDEFVQNRAKTLATERENELFKMFEESRKAYVENAPKPKLQDLKFFDEDPTEECNWTSVSHKQRPIKIIADKKLPEKLIPIHVHLEKSYIQTPDNVIKHETFANDAILTLIKEARRKFHFKDANQYLIDALCIEFKVNLDFINRLQAENLEILANQPKSLASAEDECSPTCYKSLKGISSGPSLMTFADKALIKKRLLTDNIDNCALAKDMDLPCNEVFIVSKDFTNKDIVPVRQRIKRTKLGTSQAYYHYSKRKSQYEGHPGLYVSCNHEGPCDESCNCYETKNFCEMFCNCPPDCINRFQGCVCKSKCDTKACPCFMVDRECQTGVCKNCPQDLCCSNMNITFYKPKKLVIKKSNVAGYGAFAGEFIKKGEFIIEYSGELITQDELEKRGKVYDSLKISYTFDLSKDFAVDAMFIGNEARYVNHSETGNCTVRIVTVFGDRRIGFFANRNINVDEELFFNYDYSEAMKELYFSKST